MTKTVNKILVKLTYNDKTTEECLVTIGKTFKTKRGETLIIPK